MLGHLALLSVPWPPFLSHPGLHGQSHEAVPIAGGSASKGDLSVAPEEPRGQAGSVAGRLGASASLELKRPPGAGGDRHGLVGSVQPQWEGGRRDAERVEQGLEPHPARQQPHSRGPRAPSIDQRDCAAVQGTTRCEGQLKGRRGRRFRGCGPDTSDRPVGRRGAALRGMPRLAGGQGLSTRLHATACGRVGSGRGLAQLGRAASSAPAAADWSRRPGAAPSPDSLLSLSLSLSALGPPGARLGRPVGRARPYPS